jgi:hypothetical protein
MSGSSTLTVSSTTSTPTGTYTVTVTGTSGSLSHSVNVQVTVTSPNTNCPDNTHPGCIAPSFSQMNWVHRLSLSKTGGVQTWKFGTLNQNNDTIYVSVRITAVDGSGTSPVVLNSPVVALTPGKNLTGQTLSYVFTVPGETWNWNAVIQWGTTPTSDPSQLPFSSTLNQGVPISGSFTVLP